MELNETLREQVEKVIKPDDRFCDRGCKANGGGTCIGRAKQFARPFIVYGQGRTQWLADMDVKDIVDLPDNCPFFKPGTERR